MQITIKEIAAPRKSSALASATVEITFEGHTLTIGDWRVLRNRTGELWVAPPSYAIPEGRSFHYENTFETDRVLLARIQGAVLDAYEAQRAQAVRS
jgi:DNA-binding cell septation regulator SpoVG